MSKTKICIVCGTEYKFCNTCAEFKTQPRWKNIYCSEECMDVADIVDKYRSEQIDKNEAKKMLSKYHIKQFVNFYKSIIEEINFVEKKQQNKKNKKIVNDNMK